MTQYRMLTNHELTNFDRFVRGAGLVGHNPKGAFDALPKTLRRTMKRGGIEVRHFSRGGAFDAAVPDDRVMKALKLLAGKLSAEDWAAFREVIAGGEDMSSDEPPPFKGRPETGGRMTGTEDDSPQNVETPKEIEALERKKNMAVKDYAERQRHADDDGSEENVTPAELRALQREAKAMDAKGYAERHPHAGRIGADKYPAARAPARSSPSSDFAERFPNVARIRVI